MFEVEGDFGRTIAQPPSMPSVPSGKCYHNRLPAPLPHFFVDFKRVLHAKQISVSPIDI